MHKKPRARNGSDMGPGLRRGGSSPSRSRCSRGELTGFTLLEMSIVMVIIAVILAGGAVTFSASVKQRQFESTKANMQKLQKSLLDYWRTFGRLPCPANIQSYAVEDANFGLEAANNGSCSGGTPAANWVYNIDLNSTAVCDYSDATHDNCIYGGMIPTRTLGLPDDDAFDGWGRRLTYTVHSDFTRANAAANLSDITYDAANSITRIIVKSSGGTNKTTYAAYVLVSHGMNGHGAYPRYSQVGTSRISSGSSHSQELQNCNCTTSAADGTFENTFYQSPYSTDVFFLTTTDTFDDLLVYGARQNLNSANE